MKILSHPSLTRRHLLRLCALSAASACAGAPAVLRAQPRVEGGEPLRIAVGGQSGLYYLPLTVAHGLGFFREEGLDVQLLDMAGGALALQAVRESAADVCCGAYDHVIRQQPQGMLYRSIALLGRAPQLALVVSVKDWPSRSMAGFKGLRVGVTALGSSTHFLASLWLSQAGVRLDDIRFVGVGVGDAAIAALRQGRVHALCHSDPVLTLLEQRGDVRVLADARTLKGTNDIFGGAMPGACLYAPQAFVKDQPAKVQALANAMVHALKWLQTASPADLARVVPQSHLLGDRGAYMAAFYKVRETLSPDGLMPHDGPATALRALARLQPELASARVDLDKTFSNDWVRKSRLKFPI